VIESLKKVDFYVVIDVSRTADMNFADIVLPTTTPYESDHPFEARGNWIMARRKVIEPLEDYKSIYEFFIDLGVRMGYGEDFWHGDIVTCQDDMLSPFGITLEELRRFPVGKVYDSSIGSRTYEKFDRIFQNKSTRFSRMPYLSQGKVALYNTAFEKEGYSPMPDWHEPPESLTGTPELSEKFPLVLSDYHTSKTYTASWQRNIPSLREMQPYPVLHIHPEAAAVRNIKNQDWVTSRRHTAG
jgi:anaerobic selenocysteine-containing dehydrogenase